MRVSSLCGVALLITLIDCSTYTLRSCGTNQIFDASTLSCIDCLSSANMRPNPHQLIPTNCVCNQGYYPTSATMCTPISSNSCLNYQFYNITNDDGTLDTITGAETCYDCGANAYPNQYMLSNIEMELLAYPAFAI